jgi:hypothetical protein
LTRGTQDVIIGVSIEAITWARQGILNERPFLQKVREFLYGMIGYEFEQHALEMRSTMEALFMAVTFGDMLGLPIIPPYYTLRLLPYIVPNITTWKRRVSREREFAEDHDLDLHGL